MKEEVEPFCDQVIQAPDAVRDKEQEVEPMSEGLIAASEAEQNGKESMPLCEAVIPAAEKMRNKDVQEEPEEHEQKGLLFDLLYEENDVEGVELGEEELGENDYI